MNSPALSFFSICRLLLVFLIHSVLSVLSEWLLFGVFNFVQALDNKLDNLHARIHFQWDIKN